MKDKREQDIIRLERIAVLKRRNLPVMPKKKRPPIIVRNAVLKSRSERDIVSAFRRRKQHIWDPRGPNNTRTDITPVRKMKAVILTTMWKRPKLTKFVFEHYKKLKAQIVCDLELILLAVGSEGKISRELAVKCGWEYLECENKPLNRKINAGVQRARQYDPDMLFVIDSDDIIDIRYFRAMKVKQGSLEVVGLSDYYFLDLNGGKLGYWAGYKDARRKGEPIGPGRCFNRKILEKCKWQLLPQQATLRSGMDWNTCKRLHTFNIGFKGYMMSQIGCFAMDVKTDVNLWKWNQISYQEVWEGNRVEKMLERVGIAEILSLGIKRKTDRRGRPPTPVKALKTGRHFRLDIPRQILRKWEDIIEGNK